MPTKIYIFIFIIRKYYKYSITTEDDIAQHKNKIEHSLLNKKNID